MPEWSIGFAWRANVAARLPEVRILSSPPMKIIFLNCWYAKAGKIFFDFIEKNSSSTDIFCLAEIYPKLFPKLKRILPNFKGFYEKSMFDSVMGFTYGQATFFKEKFDTQNLRRINIYRQVYNDMGYALPYKLRVHGKTLYVTNVHGKARPGHKLDTPVRLRQSKLILDFLKDKVGSKIIGGDFNLLPETRSVEMFEKAGYRNLIKEFGIKNTRNKFAWNTLKKSEEKQYFADYVFVSPDVKVNTFEVPNIEISDHLPLILDFEI